MFTGSGGAQDDAVGLTDTLRKARRNRAGVTIRGSLTLRSPVRILSGDSLEFDHATIDLGYMGNGFVAIGQSDVSVRGTLTYRGGHSQGFVGNGWLLVSGKRFRFEWDCTISDFSSDPSKYLILARTNEVGPGDGLTILGRTLTTDSTVVNTTNWSNIEVAGVCTPPGGMTGMPPVAVVNLKSDGTAGQTHGIRVHDCDLDGGGRQQTSGLVTVKGAPGPGVIQDVVLRDLKLRNMCPVPGPSLQDACDIIGVSGVQVDNVSGDTAFHGVGCIASHATITNVAFRNLNGRSVAVGDAQVQSENISDITVRNCSAVDCGQSTLGPGSGFIVAASANFSVDHVVFENCTAKDSTGHSQKYGLQVTANGKIFDVTLIGGEYSGTLGSIRNPSNVPITVQGAKV